MNRTFWDRVAGLYDLAESANRRAVRGMAEAAARRVPVGSNMLECAAGTGEISLAAAPFAGRVMCTDLSRPMLEQARRKAARRGLSNIEFSQRDLLHLPDADGSFGAVCAANVLHLLDAPEKAVAELWRVTAPGGVLILPTFLMGESGTVMKGLISVYRLLGFRQKHLFTRHSYQAFLEGLGLPVSEWTVVPGRLPVGLAVLRKPEAGFHKPDFHDC